MRLNKLAQIWCGVTIILALRVVTYTVIGNEMTLADPIIHINKTGLDLSLDIWLASWILTASGIVLYCGHVISRRSR